MPLCSLLEVSPAGVSAPFTREGVALPGWAAGEELPAGALVRGEGRCEDGSVAVSVLALPRWTSSALASPPLGARGCAPAEALSPPEGQFLVGEHAWPLRAGEVVALGGVCDAWTAYGLSLNELAMQVLRPVSARQLRDAVAVQRAYQARFGPLSLADVPLTGGDFVGLPLPTALDAAALAEEHRREGLDTPERRQRAVRWLGGPVNGRPSYAHFLGADAAYSDIWALPETLYRLFEVAEGWARACPVAATEPQRCLLQIADLAWLEDTLPDPLGHKDHHSGRCVDLRLFRDDGSRYEAWWSQPDDRPGAVGGYDQELTIAFLDWVSARSPVTMILFGDPAARRAVPTVRYAPAHDEHIHLCF